MKYIYLDQMKWIDLAKAECGTSGGEKFKSVLVAAQSAVAAGTHVFPLSFANIMETAKSPRVDQRRQLGRLMTELSLGKVLCAARPIVEVQLRQAILACFGMRETVTYPSPFGQGIECAFNFDLSQLLTISDERTQRLRQALNSPFGWLALLTHDDDASRRSAINAFHKIGQDAAMRCHNVRELFANNDYDAETYRRSYGAILTREFAREITAALHSIGRTIDQWVTLGPERLMQVWESISILNVELEMNAQMHREKSKEWSANDQIDVGFLSLAIPACDFVVTEKFWVDAARRRKLDLKYSTQLLSDVSEIPM